MSVQKGRLALACLRHSHPAPWFRPSLRDKELYTQNIFSFSLRTSSFVLRTTERLHSWVISFFQMFLPIHCVLQPVMLRGSKVLYFTFNTWEYLYWKMENKKYIYSKYVLVAQSCLTLCDPMDCNVPGSSVHGIFQTRILEWVAIFFSRGSSWPRDWTQVSCIAGRLLTPEPQGMTIYSKFTAFMYSFFLNKKKQYYFQSLEWEDRSLFIAFVNSSIKWRDILGWSKSYLNTSSSLCPPSHPKYMKSGVV